VSGEGSALFRGFHSLEANFLYCPNQFFDLCLPHCSRGVVRLVAYMLRRTLGWLDTHGNPIEQRIAVSYQDFIDAASISRGAVGQAIEDAIDARFVRRVKRGRANENGRAGEAARFELCWDESGDFISTPKEFRGFFTGEGHRSPIPNDFFDVVIPDESLAVVQVVGAVLRHTVGYQNQFGGRRQQAPLSYNYLQRYTGIGGRRHLTDAIQQALQANYIRVAQEGVFDPRAGHNGMAAQYAVKWAEDGSRLADNGSKREPAPNGSGAHGTVQKGNQRYSSKREPAEAYRKGTSNGPKREPVERFKKGTIEKTYSNNTSKQQQQSAAAADCLENLIKEGFDSRTATMLLNQAEPQSIYNQIAWLDRRQPSRNRLGMLRRAIQENWPEPQGELRTSVVSTPAGRFATCFYAGLANNPDEPLAEPSANDLAVAARFVRRLETVAGGAVEAEVWGRKFGALVRESRESGRPAVTSLVTALRTQGDRFFVELQGRLKRVAQAEAQKRGEERKKELEAEYRRHIQAIEQRLQSERPEDWKLFMDWRDRERPRYANSRVGGKRLAEWFDSLEKRLEDVRLYFEKDVPSFDAWVRLRSETPCESSPSSTPRGAAAKAPSP
jgi:hypothetical protein